MKDVDKPIVGEQNMADLSAVANAPIQHATAMEADLMFRERYQRAVVSERWMAAAWTMENGEITLVGSTMYNFLTADFDGAVALLVKELAGKSRSASEPPEPEPLPAAAVGEIK